jgi:asparagine synthase (glutamine-hydrolysing)
MSAIAGLWRLDGRPGAAGDCARMLTALAIYGRDDSSAWDGRDVALGRRLHRVVPEDVHDRQPLIGRGGQVLVGDVRVDNREELGRALGLTLRETCDAAVLLAAYERWETDAFERVAGDFACAVWEPARRRLVLACDATARRPLYYHRTERLVAFASLPKGLHALAEIPVEIDERMVVERLALFPGATTRAPFKGLQRVGAGALVVISPGEIRARRYWKPQPDTVRLRTPEDYAEALRERFDEAVAARLRGAGLVGAHLSAGLDSSAVAATAARLLAGVGGRVIGFTAAPRAGFAAPGPSWRLIDEAPMAAKVAAMHPNLEQVVVRASRGSPLAGLDRGAWLNDLPVVNPGNGVWLDAINDAARSRGLKVMLTGSLGNAGPSYDGLQLLPELLRRGRIWRWAGEASALVARGHGWRHVLRLSLGPWAPDAAWQLANRLRGRPAPGLESHCLLRADGARDLELAAQARAIGYDTLLRPPADGFAARFALLTDGGAISQPGVLAEWGLDLRDPTSDRRLLEFCLGIPTEEFLRNGVTRALARSAFADRLPQEVVNARYVGYQSADWAEGLTAAREEARAELERLEACGLAAQLIDLPRMRRLIDNWPSEGWEREDIRLIYRAGLLQALSTGRFIRRASGSNA